MSPSDEHSPRVTGASNRAEVRRWREFGRACRRAATELERAAEVLVARAVEAAGAERGYLVRGDERSADPIVEAVVSRRPDGESQPSRTLLRAALTGRRWYSATDGALSAGASVKALRLRTVLAAPVPRPAATRRVLLLDSRDASPALPNPALRELVESFAALIGLAVPDTGETTVAPAATAAAAPVGRSPRWRAMLDWTTRAARSRLPVLIRGESGSGKEGVARWIHGCSKRAGGPFVAVNCAAFAETLLDAELFGSARGAYTGSERDRPGLFRQTNGGTLLLDEVGDMSAAMQAKLLRVLQEGRIRPVGSDAECPVDVRILAATHRDLAAEVRRRVFREDLYHRLAVVEVLVPPLRQRHADLPLLVEDLAERLAHETGLGPPRLTTAAWRALRSHPWPGNVRELHAVLARALLRAGRGRLDVEDLFPTAAAPAAAPADDAPSTLERRMIEEALSEARGSVTVAAARIGWTRQKLYRRLTALGLRG